MPARPVAQAAAVPVRDGLVCLVTSRSGRRWVFPKGRIDPGSTPEDAARAEAWEEAGLTGHLVGGAVGSYRYEKNGLPHDVRVFVLAVTGEAADWPERAARRREWVPPAVAAGRVEEPGLKALLSGLFQPTAAAG